MDPVPTSSKEKAASERMFMCSDLYIAAFKGRTEEVIGLLTRSNHATVRNAARPFPVARAHGTSSFNLQFLSQLAIFTREKFIFGTIDCRRSISTILISSIYYFTAPIFFFHLRVETMHEKC